MPVRAWDPTPYPDARHRKQFGGEQAAATQTITPPRAAAWAFIVDATGDKATRSVVSRRFVGPVFVKQALIEVNPTNSGTGQAAFRLAWGTDASGAGDNGNNGPFPAGSPFFDSDFNSAAAIPPYRPDSYLRTPQSIARQYSGAILLDKWIDAGEVFLKASVIAASVGITSFSGVVSLYEQVDPETIFGLLG